MHIYGWSKKKTLANEIQLHDNVHIEQNLSFPLQEIKNTLCTCQ